MNGAHFHLMVNHLPIVFPIVGLIVMFVGLFAKSGAIKRTAYLIFILSGLASVVAMTSGEGAEEVVDQLNVVEKSYIHNHEEAAELFAILSYILAVLSLLGLWFSIKEKIFANFIAIVVALISIVVLFFARQTGTTGGEIRHTEIRTSVNAPVLDHSNMDNDDN